MRELRRNGYQVCDSKNQFVIKEQRGYFKPFDPEKPDARGLNAEIIADIGSEPRDVSYSNGIYMTAGQHKGLYVEDLACPLIC